MVKVMWNETGRVQMLAKDLAEKLLGLGHITILLI